MHRQTTTFSSRMNRVFTHRANRVSKAIERQGIRATYELHDRLLSNRSARESFAASPPRVALRQRSRAIFASATEASPSTAIITSWNGG